MGGWVHTHRPPCPPTCPPARRLTKPPGDQPPAAQGCSPCGKMCAMEAPRKSRNPEAAQKTCRAEPVHTRRPPSALPPASPAHQECRAEAGAEGGLRLGHALLRARHLQATLRQAQSGGSCEGACTSLTRPGLRCIAPLCRRSVCRMSWPHPLPGTQPVRAAGVGKPAPQWPGHRNAPCDGQAIGAGLPTPQTRSGRVPKGSALCQPTAPLTALHRHRGRHSRRSAPPGRQRSPQDTLAV